MFGLSTGLAILAMANEHAAAKRTGKFGDLLISEEGEAAVLGQQWNEGWALVREGKQLSGWFVGRKQNPRARHLIKKGWAMQADAENRYEALKADQ